jgi:DnaB-like helicase C terminal domain.
MGGKRFKRENYSDTVYEIMKEYLCKNFFWIDPDDTDINSVLERSRYLIKKKGIKALVIDPFNALSDREKGNVKQDEYISEFLQKLRAFARKYDIAIFLVMHPTKMSKMENGLYPVCDLYNCKGASEIFDKADIGLTVWRNEQDDYGELHVTKVKFRHLGEKGYTSFKFNINNGRYVNIGDAESLKKSGTDIRTMQVNWDNSNWILDKINGKTIQQNIPLENNDNNDVFTTLSEDEVPF